MNALISLVLVVLLGLLAYVGQVVGLQVLFGVVFPYLAFAVFLAGIVYRVVYWAKSPVPFRIPTTCGQQKSLPWFKQSKFENPTTLFGVLGRMFLEVFFFRSLLRNSSVEIHGDKVIYAPNRWLWMAAMAFHYGFVIVVLRHVRFFTEPIPNFVNGIAFLDGFMQLGVPVYYITSVLLVAAVSYLFLRRLFVPQVRYISLAADYFPLFLIMGIGGTGFFLRHLMKTDVIAVKELAMGLVGFSPVVPEGVSGLFYIHLFFVCILLAYFPFSKLMHMAGVFMSPTRNLANNSRMKRHINPWNYPVEVHSYEAYEDEFREEMKSVGIPVEKE